MPRGKKPRGARSRALVKRQELLRPRVQHLKLEQLADVWAKILKDKDAQRALARLEKDGFKISHLKPRDPSFLHPNWADLVASIPVLPNRLSHRRIHRKASLQKYRPLIEFMRNFEKELGKPDLFRQIHFASSREVSLDEIKRLRSDLSAAAEFLEKFLSFDWLTQDRNPRNTVIAALRWQIRWLTGSPHDADLSALIDAAYRAAGFKEGCYVDAAALDRIEKRDKEGRVKAMRRLRALNASIKCSFKMS